MEKMLEEIKAVLKETHLEVANTCDVSDLHSDGDKVACVSSAFRNRAEEKIEAIFHAYLGQNENETFGTTTIQKIKKPEMVSFLRIGNEDLRTGYVIEIFEEIMEIGAVQNYEVDIDTAEQLVKLGYLEKRCGSRQAILYMIDVEKRELCESLYAFIFSEESKLYIKNLEVMKMKKWDVELSYGIGVTVSGIQAETKEQAIKKAKRQVEKDVSVLTFGSIDEGGLEFNAVTYAKSKDGN